MELTTIEDDAAEIDLVAYLGRMVFTEEGYRLFMHTPHEVLGGLKPVEAIDQGRVQDVIGILAGYYEGVLWYS